MWLEIFFIIKQFQMWTPQQMNFGESSSFATTGFILRHWLVVTKIAGCDILNFLVVVTDYINIYTAGKSGTALLLLRLAFLQNSLQGIAPLDV